VGADGGLNVFVGRVHYQHHEHHPSKKPGALIKLIPGDTYPGYFTSGYEGS
jgi:hypothetical protein